jgi:hypothetical protein
VLLAHVQAGKRERKAGVLAPSVVRAHEVRGAHDAMCGSATTREHGAYPALVQWRERFGGSPLPWLTFERVHR